MMEVLNSDIGKCCVVEFSEGGPEDGILVGPGTYSYEWLVYLFDSRDSFHIEQDQIVSFGKRIFPPTKGAVQ